MGIEASETENTENIDLEALAAQESEQQNEPGQQEEVQLSEVEQKAFDQGWRPEEEFEGPKEKWKSAKEYIRDGEYLDTIKQLNQRIDRQEADFKQRLENSNKLHEARRQNEIDKLRQEQRNAVDAQDTDAFDAAQTQIDELEKETLDETVVSKDPDVAAWEAKNPWINDNSNFTKRPAAQALWSEYLANNPGATTTQALTHVDGKMSELFPDAPNTNLRRNQPNTTETNAKRGKAKGKKLSMSDLTPDERQEWNMYGTMMFKTEEAFLKAVEDTRKQ